MGLLGRGKGQECQSGKMERPLNEKGGGAERKGALGGDSMQERFKTTFVFPGTGGKKQNRKYDQGKKKNTGL